MNTRHVPNHRPAAMRLIMGVGALRDRVSSVFNRAQLGPSTEREWQHFVPGRRIGTH